ncbi:MAG: ECF transporter S component [Oscillospiraceae bacterium]|jgi:hypothetical protein|nr:ECF transporter S component [Oscillospiraceae bacterium]
MNKKRIKWITQTAIFLAMLIAVQFLTSQLVPPPATQYVTGSIVNLLLAVSAVICGLSSGLTVALISPVLAKLVGIGPLWEIVPFVAVGNAILVLLWYFIGIKKIQNFYISYIIAAVSGAVLKFLFLFLSITKFAVPIWLQLPEKQAVTISAMFSFPQLITALIGGALAALILPSLKKALKTEE